MDLSHDVSTILEDFSYEHLEGPRPDLAKLSRPFCEIARDIASSYPHDMKLIIFLDDLMKAKDSVLRVQVAAKRREARGE